MLEPEVVDRIHELSGQGLGSKRIARELGVSRNTVRRYTPRGAERAFSGRGDCDRPMRLTARMFIQKALPCKEAHHDLASHSIDRGAAASR